MVDGLKGLDRVRVQQALHGYMDGHRLIACSASLKPRDAKAMLILSDASGPGASIDESGYLTGYPLPEAGLYALARTWAAPEMSRPGCVWTHTLLIDFADLAVLPTITGLLRVFRRPAIGIAPDGYDLAIMVEAPDASSPLSLDDAWRETLRNLLWALYAQPKARVTAASASPSQREALALALWAQQWPRLRRSFRFCTLAVADRSSDGAPFDLQFVPARERTARSRFTNAVDADRLLPEPIGWLDDALVDLMEGGHGGLRSFLRQVGGDIPGGREAFVPLCRLFHLMLEFANSPAALDDAAELLSSAFGHVPARAARTLVASAGVERIETLGERALNFVIEHLELLAPADLQKQAEDIGGVLWRRDPAAIGRLFTGGTPKRIVAERTLVALPISDLVSGLKGHPQLAPLLLQHRPEVVEQPAFWACDGHWRADTLAAMARENERGEAVLMAVLASGIPDIIPETVRAFGADRTFSAVVMRLDYLQVEDPVGADAAWLRAVVPNSGAMAQSLSRGDVHTRATLVAMARSTHPDHVPNEYGEDPWWTAVKSAGGEVSKDGRQYLAAYLMSRALGYRSRNQAELIALCFDDIYLSALCSRVSSAAWRLLDQRLQSSPWWDDWDYCHRLRASVVSAFIDRNLWPLAFAQLSSEDAVFTQLAKGAIRKWGGRSYLRSVKHAMKISNSEKFDRRIEIIEEVL